MSPALAGLFCGDPCGSYDHIIDAAHQLKPMAVVLLGDMESPRPLHIELEPIRGIVWWITGNHDTDRPASWSHLVDSELADRCIDGRVVTLPDGTRLAGLGGVFRGKIWDPPRDPVHESYDAWLDSLQPGWRKRPSMFATERLRGVPRSSARQPGLPSAVASSWIRGPWSRATGHHGPQWRGHRAW